MTILVGLSVCVSSVSLALSLLFAFLNVSLWTPADQTLLQPLCNCNRHRQNVHWQWSGQTRHKIEANQEGEERTRGEETSQELLYTTQLGHTIGEESSYQSRATISIFFCYRTDPGRTRNPTKSFVYFRDLYMSVEQIVVRILVKNATPGLFFSGARRNRSSLGSQKNFLACTFDATWLLEQVHLRIHYCKFL